MSAEIVGFENVVVHYETPILSGVTFSFLDGGFYFLTGASGVGKTTLLRLIYRDLHPQKGAVKVFSRNLAHLSKSELPIFRRRIGLVFQDCRLCDHLNALENVLLPLKIMRSFTKRSLSHAKDLLDWVGLGEVFESYPKELSDGQRQRVAIARAVLGKPLLLLADEPTGNVDDMNAKKLIVLFKELNKKGTTIILATHNHSLIQHHQEVRLENGDLNLYNDSHYKISA